MKTWFKLTMTQNRLNIPGILYCHKEGTDNLDLAAVANIFVSKHDTWKSTFGTFSRNDFA